MPVSRLLRTVADQLFLWRCNLRYQTTLDTASEGNFRTMSPKDAIKLIENVATVRAFKKMTKNKERKSNLVMS